MGSNTFFLPCPNRQCDKTDQSGQEEISHVVLTNINIIIKFILQATSSLFNQYLIREWDSLSLFIFLTFNLFYMKTLYITFLLLCVISMKTLAQPFQTEIYSDAHIVTGDIQYGNQLEKVLRLYTPNNQVSKPLLVMALGSGFYDNGVILRNQYEAQARSFAKRGYAVIVIDYKRVTDPCNNFYYVVGEAAADVHASIQYTIANRGAWNINPNYIFIWGLSAGGIAATSAIWCSDQKFQDIFAINKNKNSLYPGVTYSIKGLGLESSGVLDINIFEYADLNHSIPIVMSQGIYDAVVPYNGGQSSGCSNTPSNYVAGTGRLLQSITTPGNPKSGTCYMMYKYITAAHDLRFSGANMPVNLFNNVMVAFAWIIGNQPCVQQSVYLNPNRLGEEDHSSSFMETATEHIQFQNDQIAFDFSPESGVTQFRLFDLNGIERKQQAVNSRSIISTQDLNAGVYIAILETENGTIKKKIVVQR